MSTLFIQGSADLYGSAKILLQLVGICVRQNQKVIVVLPHEGLLVDELKKLGVTVFVINIGVLRRRYFTPLGILGRFFLWISSIIRIYFIIKKNCVSKIYINSANVVIGPFLKKITGLPLIWHLHEIVEKPAILRKFLTMFILKADKVIAVSNATKQFWSSQSDKLKIEMLHNGIDRSLYEGVENLIGLQFPFTLKKNSNVILIAMIGRVQPWKGQHYFLKIMRSFYDRFQNDVEHVYAVIVGDPYPGYEYYADELKANIRQNGLEEKVFYLGYRRDIPEILSSVDLLVLPSILPDPLPTVVLEAMASRKAVLSTKQGGALEMVCEGENGYFIPIDDHEKSALILHDLLLDPNKLQYFGNNGYNRVKDFFSIDSFEKNWIKFFRTF